MVTLLRFNPALTVSTQLSVDIDTPTLFIEFLTVFHIPTSDVFVFDNSYSWMRHKELYYSLTVLPPGSEPADEFSSDLATDSRSRDVNPSTDGAQTGLTTEEHLDSVATSTKIDKVATEGP